ncbi:activating transcription factor 7-interacting protein 1-like isoform X2 [Euwallacea fornicatus]|uniref:activating transcription factor 7-interacting protein 1-like isoform X2 n=1 Tax=Euwallacea fornicatus TaxID=995702 RepID=UPI00338F5640
MSKKVKRQDKDNRKYIDCLLCDVNKAQYNTQRAFFRFPKDIRQKEMWVDFCVKCKVMAYSDMPFIKRDTFLCSGHFHPFDIITASKRLKKGAVPIFVRSEIPPAMPSIEQCDVASGNVAAALPSTLEIFDKFKPTTEDGNSDSEESFHLVLDEDDVEMPNGREKETRIEESEDEIMNKFDTLVDTSLDNLDEDKILNDVDLSDTQNGKERACTKGAERQSKTVKTVKNKNEDFKNNADGEFNSSHAHDTVPSDSTKSIERPKECIKVPQDSEVNDAEISHEDKMQHNEKKNLEDATEDVSMLLSQEGKKMSKDETSSNKTRYPAQPVNSLIRTLVEYQEFCEDPPEILEICSNFSVSKKKSATIEHLKSDSTTSENPCKSISGELTQSQIEKELTLPITTTTTASTTTTTTQNSLETANITESEENSPKEANETEHKITENNTEDKFKFPADVPTKTFERSTSETHSEDKESIDDESDLMDVSMVRETEEDDACAIADAIEENTALADAENESENNEKSDGEQSDRTEAEQESCDMDKDRESNDDNDNSMGFDEDDTHSSLDMPVESKEDADSSSKAVEEDTSGNVEASQEVESTVGQECLAVDEASQEVDSAVDQDEQALVVDEAARGEKSTEDANMVQPEKSEVANDTNKTDNVSVAEPTDVEMETAPEEGTTAVIKSEVAENSENTERRKSANKRNLSLSDSESTGEASAKKTKLIIEAPEPAIIDTVQIQTPSEPVGKLKTLTSFAKFMQCRKLTAKLSRSDLEQFCIQKICESLMLKSTEGELSQSIKKHEKTIEALRKDLNQLTKQCKDLEIVNKKLMNELRNQNGMKKPLVPLKITRSVGLQVRLNPATEVVNQNRRRQTMPNTPPKVVTPTIVANKTKLANVQPSVVRQLAQNLPPRSPLATSQTTAPHAAPMLSQALQKKPILVKRTTPVRKPGPGVIDLTDEDDRLKRPNSKVLNKTVSSAGTPTKTVGVNKAMPTSKVIGNNQGKQMAVSKGSPLGPNKGNNLSPGIRLTPAITTTANGSPQMVYVVPTLASNEGGQQKLAFVNVQQNGVLSGALNGSTVLANKQGQTITLKTVPMRHKHPAPLPVPVSSRALVDTKLKAVLPKPHLTIKKIDTGIILQWKMPYNLDLYESIASYQLYAYQESSSPPSTEMWRKVGDVKALALPMACTLTQFADKNKYYFAVRSVDVHKRIGAFSDPQEISL